MDVGSSNAFCARKKSRRRGHLSANARVSGALFEDGLSEIRSAIFHGHLSLLKQVLQRYLENNPGPYSAEFQNLLRSAVVRCLCLKGLSTLEFLFTIGARFDLDIDAESLEGFHKKWAEALRLRRFGLAEAFFRGGIRVPILGLYDPMWWEFWRNRFISLICDENTQALQVVLDHCDRPEALRILLMMLAAQHSENVFRFLVNESCNPNTPLHTGEPPLIYLIRQYGMNEHDWQKKAKSLKGIELLIRYGADVEAIDSDGRTALHVAASVTDSQILRLLIFNGAQINRVDPWGNTALMKVALVHYSSDQVVGFLMLQGGDPRISNREGQTAFHTREPKILDIINHHFDPSLDSDPQGWTELMTLATDPSQVQNQLNRATDLLTRNPELINQTTRQGFNALLLATLHTQTSLVRILLDAGADIFQEPTATAFAVAGSNLGSRNFVFLAVKNGNSTLLRLVFGYIRTLIKKNTDDQKRDSLKKIRKIRGMLTSALELAEANRNSAAIVEIYRLLKMIPGQDFQLETSSENSVEIAEDFHRSVNERLLRSAENNDIEAARTAIRQGARINVKPDFLDSPLTSATTQGNTSVVQLLIRNGASPHETSLGETAFSIAERHSNRNELLSVMHGALSSSIGADSQGFTSLMTVAEEGDLKQVQLQLQNDPGSLNRRTVQRWNALSYALLGNHAQVVELFFESGAEIHLPGDPEISIDDRELISDFMQNSFKPLRTRTISLLRNFLSSRILREINVPLSFSDFLAEQLELAYRTHDHLAICEINSLNRSRLVKAIAGFGHAGMPILHHILDFFGRPSLGELNRFPR